MFKDMLNWFRPWMLQSIRSQNNISPAVTLWTQVALFCGVSFGRQCQFRTPPFATVVTTIKTTHFRFQSESRMLPKRSMGYNCFQNLFGFILWISCRFPPSDIWLIDCPKFMRQRVPFSLRQFRSTDSLLSSADYGYHFVAILTVVNVTLSLHLSRFQLLWLYNDHSILFSKFLDVNQMRSKWQTAPTLHRRIQDHRWSTIPISGQANHFFAVLPAAQRTYVYNFVCLFVCLAVTSGFNVFISYGSYRPYASHA